MPSLVAILVLALAVYRVSLLLVIEDGPFRVFDRIRAGANAIGADGAFGCIYCMSVWASAGALLLWTYGGVVGAVVLLWLALSGAAVLAHKAVERSA